jgi:hypothetical protein
MRKLSIAASLLFLFNNCSSVFAQSKKTEREYYQVTVYHFKTADQQQVIDNYLEMAYLPALHRKGISQAGVFTPLANDTAIDKKLYMILPVKSLQQAADLPAALLKDTVFQRAGKNYLDAVYSNPPYTRIEIILAYAFPKAPMMKLPVLSGPKQDRIYEFRSYESATEKLYYNKVQMFNDGGEVALFKRLNFNAIFYAGVIAGANMPNLIYMTSFENMTERDAHWKTFSADPEWKKLSSDPVYQKNVSKADITLMRATAYSDY